MKILTLTLALGCSGCALAAPTGPYIFLGGGGVYLPDSALKNSTITSSTTGNTTNYNISYRQKAKFNYMGRAAVGYYFNSDPSNVSAFGVEAGYNYFGPVNSTANNSFTIPGIPGNFGVPSSEKTNAWAGDLEGVFSQDLIIPNTALIVKLGLGYEHMQSSITNPARVSDGTFSIPNPISSSTIIKNNGLGVAGGIGLQYNFTQHIGMRVEFDGMKGEKNVGYATSLAGLQFSF